MQHRAPDFRHSELPATAAAPDRRTVLRGSCALVAGLAGAKWLSGDGQAVAADSDSPTLAGSSTLADLPSKPGEHLKKLAALGDNEWIDLGLPTPDPQWGLARGRSYTPKMAVSKKLGGAFLYGEGIHGYTKPDGRYMDDLWFYDARGHRWVCCYPGVDVKNIDEKLDERGFGVRPDGQSIPMAASVHGYNLPAYSDDANLFMALGGTSYANKSIMAAREKLLPNDEAKRKYFSRKHPFFYNAVTGKWTRHEAKGSPATADIYGATIEWFPTLEKFVFYGCKSTLWAYDLKAQQWSELKPTGPSPDCQNYEGVSCYDTRRNRLCIFNRAAGTKPGKFAMYDVAANAWIAPKDDFQPDVAAGGRYETFSSFAHYDSASDAIVLSLKGKKTRGIYVYDIAADKWTREPVNPTWARGYNAFYDSELNVHFWFDAGDSTTKPGNIWAWRYKHA